MAKKPDTTPAAKGKTEKPVEKAPEKAPGNTMTPPKAPNGTALVPANLQAMLEEDVQQRQQFSREDLSVPFLRVLQSNSPQVDDADPAFIPEAAVGDFLNTSTLEMWDGKEGVILVPVLYQKSYTEWIPRKKGGGLVKDWGEDPRRKADTHKDEETGRDVTPDGNELLTAALYYVMIVDPESGQFDQAVFALSSTQLKKARRWNNLINATTVELRGKTEIAPMHYQAYKVTTVPEENEKGKWRGVVITPYAFTLALPNGEEIYRAARILKKGVQAGTIKAAPPEEALAPQPENGNGNGHGENPGKDFETMPREPGEDDDLPF